MTTRVKCLDGPAYTGEVPKYIEARDRTISGIRIIRQIQESRYRASAIASLYIGTADQLRTSGLIKNFEQVRLPSGYRMPSGFHTPYKHPKMRCCKLYRYSESEYCAYIEEDIPSQSKTINGVTVYEFWRNEMHELTMHFGSAEALAELTNDFEDPFSGNGGKYTVEEDDFSPLGYESFLAGDRWLWVEYVENLRKWEAKKSEAQAEHGPQSANDYKENLIRWFALVHQAAESLREGRSGHGAYYKLPEDVIDEVRDAIAEAYHAIKEATIEVRRLDTRTDEEKELARLRVASCQSDPTFQRFLKSLQIPPATH